MNASHRSQRKVVLGSKNIAPAANNMRWSINFNFLFFFETDFLDKWTSQL